MKLTRFVQFSFASLIAAFALLGSATAEAQSLPLVGPPSGVSVGVFTPSSSEAKNAGTSQLAVEARYGLPGVPLTPTRTVFAVGYEGGSKSGSSSTIVPVTIAEYYGSGNFSPFAPSRPYVGIGTGAYYENQSGQSSKVNFGGFVAVGYNLSILFAEAKYQLVSRGNGATFSVGLRF